MQMARNAERMGYKERGRFFDVATDHIDRLLEPMENLGKKTTFESTKDERHYSLEA
jgi:hypothetical protein